MSKWNKLEILVGEKSIDDSKKIRLDGIIKPNPQSDRNLLVVLGLNFGFVSYLPFLEKFNKHFTVITYNQRGQIDSGTCFDPSRLSDDLDQVLDLLNIEKTFVLAHSAGALAVSNSRLNSNPYFLMTPCLGQDSFSRLYQFGLKTCRLLNNQGFNRVSNKILGNSTNPNFINGATNLLTSPQIVCSEKKVGFFIADNDEVLGTYGNPYHLSSMKSSLRELFPYGKDHSLTIKGLNHFLNLNPYNFSEFCKDEKGKDSQRIIHTIVSFYNNLK